MAAFATVDDLAALLGETIDAADLRALTLLDLTADVIRADVGQQISAVAGDEVTLDGMGTDLLLLPELPVTEVTSVSVDGAALVDGTDFSWAANGILHRIGGTWAAGARNVTVVYDHGYAAPPGVCVTVNAQVAARAWANPGGLRQESIGDYARSWAVDVGASGIRLTEQERRLLDGLRP